MCSAQVAKAVQEQGVQTVQGVQALSKFLAYLRRKPCATPGDGFRPRLRRALLTKILGPWALSTGMLALVGGTPFDKRVGPLRAFDKRVGPLRAFDKRVGPLRAFDKRVGPRRPFDRDIGPLRPFDRDIGLQRPFDGDIGPRRPFDRDICPRRPFDGDIGPFDKDSELILGHLRYR